MNDVEFVAWDGNHSKNIKVINYISPIWYNIREQSIYSFHLFASLSLKLMYVSVMSFMSGMIAEAYVNQTNALARVNKKRACVSMFLRTTTEKKAIPTV